MQRPQISSYKRRYINEISEGINVDNTAVFLCVIGFLLGRAVIIDNLGPFGIAYFIYMCTHKKYKIPVFFSISAGIILSHSGPHALRYIITLFFINFISSFISKYHDNIFRVSIIGFFITSISGIVCSLVTDLYIYDVLVSVIEGLAVSSLIYIYSYGIPLILKRSIRRSISSEETIALGIIVALSITGISNISLFDVSLKNVLSFLTIIVVSYQGGPALGSASGITIGIVTTMNTISSPMYIGIYGFSGLLGGLFRKVSKYATTLGFIMGWSIITIYTRGSSELVLSIREICISSLIFLMIPDHKLKYIEKFTKGVLGSEESSFNYINRVKEIMNTRLKDVYKAYEEVGATFDKAREKDKVLDQRDIASVIDMVTHDICSDCPMKRGCWNLKFTKTYGMFTNILNHLEEDGRIDNNYVRSKFERDCMKFDDVIKGCNHYFDLFMLNYKWNKKLCETRKLVSSQIKSIAYSIEDVSNEINNSMDFDMDMENNIIVELDKENIQIDKISYIKRDDNFEINIQRDNCCSGDLCERKLIKAVSRAVEQEVSAYKMGCRSMNNTCNIRLVNFKKYTAKTDVAYLSKDGNIISGDNYTYMEISDGKYISVLSDGMGKGEKASEESSLTIEILEKMLEAKIDEKISIETINNMLMLKSSDEIFSTLDLNILDLNNGNLESVKMGACPSFIKRKNGGVEVISSSSLPIGILSEIKIDRERRNVREGDIIITISDGIIDAGKDKQLGENWLYTVIESMDKKSTKEIAKYILDKSLELVNGKAQDDMTVIVTKIWRNRK